jgi:bifunctional enzyme CysN/CysC
VVDATTGVKEQTRRHLCIAALLGVRQLVVCANKMDRADWSEAAYDKVVAEMEQLSATLGIDSLTVIPISALFGDNVVERSDAAPYYEGPTLLEALETAPTGLWAGTPEVEASRAARLPVQWILRQPGGGRYYAGMVSGATLKVGEAVTVLPAGLSTTVAAIETPAGPADEAPVGLSVSVSLADDLDVSRGDLIVGSSDLPTVTSEFTATLCWFTAAALKSGTRFRIKHTTRSTPAMVTAIQARLDVNDLSLEDVEELANNDIGVVTVKTASPLAVDNYAHNRITGSFVLIDEVSNITVAAGMVGPPHLVHDLEV